MSKRKKTQLESDSAKRIARLIGKLESQAECRELRKRMDERATLIGKRLLDAENAEAFDMLTDSHTAKASVMLNASIAVYHRDLLPKEKLEVIEVRRGRKHIGVFVSSERLRKNRAAKNRYIWIPKHNARDLVPYVDSTDEEKEAAAELPEMMSNLFGARS